MIGPTQGDLAPKITSASGKAVSQYEAGTNTRELPVEPCGDLIHGLSLRPEQNPPWPSSFLSEPCLRRLPHATATGDDTLDVMEAEELQRAAQLASLACDRAREEILPRFRDVDVEFKADGSPVTEADRAAERAIRRILGEAYPDFGLLGEEYGEDDSGGEGKPQWIIDPIDGTISFSRGIPLFGTLIALMEDDDPVVGVIDLPALDERYVGWRGGGCLRDGVPVRTSQADRLDRALIAVGDPICFEWAGRRPVLDRLQATVPLVRGYTDAFGHAMVLCGGLDAMVDCDLNPWDAAATQLLAVEAGGACVTRRGARGKLDLVFGSPALVAQITEFFEDSG